MKLSLLALLSFFAVASAFFQPHSTVSPLKLVGAKHAPTRELIEARGLFGPSEAEQEADRKAMENMNEQEKLNYLSWKQTNAETDSMTVVSVLAIIPFVYFLWVALFADSMAD